MEIQKKKGLIAIFVAFCFKCAAVLRIETSMHFQWKQLNVYTFSTQKMDCTFKLATLCILHFPQILGSGLYLTNNKMYVCYELFALGMMNYIFLFPLTINICIPQLSLPCMFLKIGWAADGRCCQANSTNHFKEEAGAYGSWGAHSAGHWTRQ